MKVVKYVLEDNVAKMGWTFEYDTTTIKRLIDFFLTMNNIDGYDKKLIEKYLDNYSEMLYKAETNKTVFVESVLDKYLPTGTDRSKIKFVFNFKDKELTVTYDQ